jgi:putative oxidoreductase
MLNNILRTSESGWTILVRLLVGLVVFLPEGIQKLVFADVLGAGRFAKIGIPYPDVMGPFVGVALVSTKLPILVGHDVGMFHLARDIKRTGFWSMMHEARADLTMLLGCVYLLIVGAGRWSLDAVLAR